MTIPKTQLSLEAFERLTLLPENAESRFELIDGEVFEVPSNPYSSQIAIIIAAALLAFVRPRRLGHVTGEGAGYRVSGQDLSPDVEFVSLARQERLAERGYNPVAPDLVVEVVSHTDKQPDIRRKLAIYAQAGVLVWLVYPLRQVIEIYAPDMPVEIRTIDGTLDGGTLLPGFTLAISDIFTE
jgi:Uma2 family endonuclease